MTEFLRLLADKNKSGSLSEICRTLREGVEDQRHFQVDPQTFRIVPGAPFAYWISERMRNLFNECEPFGEGDRSAQHGCSTKDDTRFVRLYWEAMLPSKKWYPYAKGGSSTSFYEDIVYLINWKNDAEELEAALLKKFPYLGDNANWVLHRESSYFQPGLKWPLRASFFAPQAMPAGVIFSGRSYAAFADKNQLLWLLGLMNSAAFDYLFKILLGRFGFPEFLIGTVALVPMPEMGGDVKKKLGDLGLAGLTRKRTLDSSEETSHAFILPAHLRGRLGDYDSEVIVDELSHIQAELDAMSFELYELSESDRDAVQTGSLGSSQEEIDSGSDQNEDENDGENGVEHIDVTSGLLSWAIGVAFGRFDWRLATGERKAPEGPEPFDPLPNKSPGMLPDGAEPFHAHAGILVDDEGHPHDLPYLLEEVLQRVDAPVQVDTRRWLQREFFPFHLKRYSKSRRRAPIYWPLSTLSGAYTLWLYYPALSSQTLFTAVNDFIEPKLLQVHRELESLRGKGNSRTKKEEKQFEIATDLAQELADLRDALLAIAPKYSPNHDDGVQITAAPLWQLFRHKPWQKVLNDTWEKLEQGDYDWAHLAMNYWPERVLRKCHQDRSLAIAHDFENTFWHQVEVPVMRGKKPTGDTKLEWQPKALTDDELDALIQAKIKETRT